MDISGQTEVLCLLMETGNGKQLFFLWQNMRKAEGLRWRINGTDKKKEKMSEAHYSYIPIIYNWENRTLCPGFNGLYLVVFIRIGN